MTEDFLYYLWQYKTYKLPLCTMGGEEITVLDTGMRNYDSGPDFSFAKLKIGDTVWAGNVEMHLKSSDWIRHGHGDDPAYESVILHVVYEHDADVVTSGGSKLDVLELKERLENGEYARYKKLITSKTWVACSGQIKEINDVNLYAWLDRLLVERLEAKVEVVEALLQSTKNNWEQAFYISLARNFGFNTNSDAFELLARHTPIEVLARYKNSLFQLEALLFGQSSLINPNLKEEYPKSLYEEYVFLQKKHHLSPINASMWKFLRMRPVNFPSIRIAQFAKLVHQSSHLFSVIIDTDKLEDLRVFFELDPSVYWEDHYVFGKKSKVQKKCFGYSSFDLVLINTIVPFLFVYAQHQGDEALRNRALMFLQHTKAESNAMVKSFGREGVKVHHAGHSQALIQLKNNYCQHQKCLQCTVGICLVKA